jgi:hypothetical protein
LIQIWIRPEDRMILTTVGELKRWKLSPLALHLIFRNNLGDPRY